MLSRTGDHLSHSHCSPLLGHFCKTSSFFPFQESKMFHFGSVYKASSEFFLLEFLLNVWIYTFRWFFRSRLFCDGCNYLLPIPLLYITLVCGTVNWANYVNCLYSMWCTYSSCLLKSWNVERQIRFQISSMIVLFLVAKQNLWSISERICRFFTSPPS